MDKEITVTITTSNRPDLLERTLDSFLKFNTYPIKNYLIADDSGIKGINDNLKEKYKNLNIIWIDNDRRIGQMRSIDNIYSMVETEYLFHLEDDWEFIKSGFMEKSIDILESDETILQIWIRGQDDIYGHSIVSDNDLYDFVSQGWRGVWYGFSFNPGLRRLSDYNKVKPYAKIGFEWEISLKYKDLGFRAAILKDKYIIHIGEGRHTYGAGEPYNE